MHRYFSVEQIKWKPGKKQGADWHVTRFNNLPTDINFISLENPTDLDADLRSTLLETYGYCVDSFECIELTEEQANERALFLLLGIKH